MAKTFLTTMALASYVTLMGCGTTGPLYIPEQRYPQEVKSETPKAVETKPSEPTINE